MRTHSDSVVHTDQFRADVIAYMKRNTTSLREVSDISSVDWRVLKQFIDGNVGVTLNTFVRLAVYADLPMDRYAKTPREMEEYKDRNKRIVRTRKYDQPIVRDWATGEDVAI